jgi:hypothetical protein
MLFRSLIHSILALGLATFVGIWPRFVAAKQAPMVPSLKPSLEEFREVCQSFRREAQKNKQTSRIRPPPLGEVLYVPIGALEAGQNRFSFVRLLKALDKLAENEGLDRDKARIGGHVPAYDNGRSFYPKQRKTTGIYYRGKVYILDGHHRSLLSTFLGAQTLPMEVVDNWSHLDPETFLNQMHQHGYSFFLDSNGNPQEPLDLCELIDDAFLALARELLLRVDIEVKEIKPKKTKPEGKRGKSKKKNWKSEPEVASKPPALKIKILARRGSKIPIAVKINRDIPFIEIEIADLLRRAGITWNPGDPLTVETLREFLEILSQRDESGRFAQVLLLEAPTSVKELDNKQLMELIANHINRIRCEYQLMSGDAD